MDNTQRCVELARARTQATKWAEAAEDSYIRSEAVYHDKRVNMALMWATVANALKVGSDVADRA